MTRPTRCKYLLPAMLAGAASAASVHAHAAPVGRPSTAPQAVAQARPKIDPRARDLLNRMGARYKAARSYSDVMTLSTTPAGAFGAGRSDEFNFRARVAWERPNKARIEKFGALGRAFSSSDGRRLRAYSPLHPGRYLERAANFNSITDAMNEVGVGAPGLGHIVDGRGVGFLMDALTSLQMGPDSTIDGVRVRQVVARLEFPSGGSAVETLSIGARDGLLRRVTQKYAPRGREGRGVTIVETHSRIQMDPALPATAFAFAPPRGTRPIDYYSRLDPDAGKPRVKPGERLAPFEAPGLDGKPVRLADFGGQPLVIHFFATWEATAGDVPPMVEIFNRHKGRGLRVVGVALDARREQVERFVKRQAVPYPVLFDGQGWGNAVAKLYGVRSLPTTLLVARDGTLRRVLERPSYAGFEEAIADLVREAEPASTPAT